MTDKDKKLKILALVAIVVVVASIGAYVYTSQQDTESATKETRTITDMAGRTVEMPVEVNRVIGTSPPTTMIVYMLAPDKLMGWNFKPGGSYMSSKYLNLPVVGGWFGKQSANYENMISMNPDIVLEGFTTQGDLNTTIIERQQKFGEIPVVGVTATADITANEAPIRFLGEILGEEEKAAELISFYNKIMNDVNIRVSQIPESEKKRVYYAEGPQGLMTDPKGSTHSQLIELCGGINVAKCPLKKGMGMREVSIEQVLKWDPDVIIARDPIFYKNVFSNPLWQNVTAVKNHEVYLTPDAPFCWFDRPHGANRIIGIPWTAKILYPERFEDLDLNSLTKEFYSKFYHYNLTDEEVYDILNPGKGDKNEG